MDPSALSARKIILGVSGGIAAYKVAQVARDLTQIGADVRVVMTTSAQRFVGAQTFAALTGNPVGTALFAENAEVPHVELARGAHAAVLAPATANAIAKLANGFADDLLSATFLTVTCPVIVVPAMHTEMWENRATQANIELLKERGIHVIGPAVGPLSSGDSGRGRMVEPDEIVDATASIVGRGEDLAGKRLMITAGGTREPIDPVRYIGNHSSGRMGYLLAEEAARRGAKVLLVSGATNLVPPAGVEVVAAHTALEMEAAVMDRAADVDAIVKAAAVADFRPSNSSEQKLKKASGAPDVHLVPNPDILRELGAWRRERGDGPLLIGFAAETEPDLGALGRYAEGKRQDKGADAIVANQVGVADSGFEVGTNRAVIATAGGVEELGLIGKPALARRILDLVSDLLSASA